MTFFRQGCLVIFFIRVRWMWAPRLSRCWFIFIEAKNVMDLAQFKLDLTFLIN